MEALVAQLAAQPGIDVASPVFLDERGGPMWVGRDVMIGYGARATAATRDVVNAGVGKLATRDFTPGIDRVTSGTADGFAILAAANAAAGRADVVSAEPDMVVRAYPALIPNDPTFGTQWGLHNTGQSGGVVNMDVNAPEAWDITTGAASIVVAVLDSGVDLAHPDLNLTTGFDATGNGTNGGPGNACDNHGTFMAGIVSAKINNALGVVGVAPACTVASVRDVVSDLDCGGGFSTTLGAVVSAIDYARTSGARVTNSSKGLPVLAAVQTAYDNAYAAGVINFAGTGNDGANGVYFPASANNVIAVGSINRSGVRSSFSNYGTGIDFVAPGEAIDSTDRQGAIGYSAGDYTNQSGTSAASPCAAGVAALILSYNPNLTAAQVETIMQQSATDRGTAGYDTEYGYGIVNARGALNITPPPNDVCGNAIDVSAGGTFNGTLVAATNDGVGLGACGSAQTNPDVWYKFINGGCPALLRVTTCGTNDASGVDTGIDTVVSVVASCGGSEILCNDDADGGGCGAQDGGLWRDSLASTLVGPGQTVLIRVSKFGVTGVGGFRLNVSASIANDACASALTVVAGAATPFCTSGATTDGPAEAMCLFFSSNQIDKDLWYRYTPSTNGPFTVRTCGSLFDTKVGIYPNSCPVATGTVLACNDDSTDCPAASVTSSLRYKGTAATTYLIRVGGFQNASGQGTLRVFCPADYDLSGTLAVADIFAYLNDWFNGVTDTDFNGNGTLQVQDIFDFLGAWFAGCA
jgi:subtilisin family serine protease